MDDDPSIGNIEQVNSAFGMGDVPTILDLLTDDVDWRLGAERDSASWHERHVGRASAAQFFPAPGATTEVTEFTSLSLHRRILM